MMLRVSFQPSDVDEPERKVCVVVDVLRATSTLAAMLHVGCDDILLEPTVEAARRSAGGRLLCGESGGLKPDGFHFGNSTAEFARQSLSGRPIVFATTNGTKALQVARRSPAVYAGSVNNGPAVCRVALATANRLGLDLELVCAGRAAGTGFALDDTVAVGYLASLLISDPSFHEAVGEDELALGDSAPDPRETGPFWHLHDTASAAWRIYRSYLTEHQDPSRAVLAAFSESASGRGLRSVGLGEDVSYCAQADITSSVPRAVVDGERVRIVRADAVA